MNSAELETLVQQARSGSDQARTELFRRLSRYLMVVADDRLPADLRGKFAPSDVVQETLLEANRGLANFQGASATQFKGWLRRILVNKVRDIQRRFRRSPARDTARERQLDSGNAANLAGTIGTPSAAFGRHETTNRLLRAIEGLPEDRREVVILRNFELMSFVDIGERMGRSPDAVRFLWNRAVESLRGELGDA